MNRNHLTVSQTEQKMVFEYMGDARKFYTPDEFTSYHDVYSALTWMKTAEINFKAGKLVYPLGILDMPDDYEHGSSSEFDHVLTGLAIIAKLRLGRDVKKNDVLSEIGLLTKTKQTIQLSKSRKIEVSVRVNKSTIQILQSPLFLPLLSDEMREACKYVNSTIVNRHLTALNTNSDHQNMKLVIGENRGITTYDVKLFESVKGSFKEIKLDHRINK